MLNLIFNNCLLIIIGSGVAIGAGWQAAVAYVNIACYYVFGVPLGLVMGYKLNMGVRVSTNLIYIIWYIILICNFCLTIFLKFFHQGIWLGMLSGTVVQTCVLFFMVYKTNWNREVFL